MCILAAHDTHSNDGRASTRDPGPAPPHRHHPLCNPMLTHAGVAASKRHNVCARLAARSSSHVPPRATLGRRAVLIWAILLLMLGQGEAGRRAGGCSWTQAAAAALYSVAHTVRRTPRCWWPSSCLGVGGGGTRGLEGRQRSVLVRGKWAGVYLFRVEDAEGEKKGSVFPALVCTTQATCFTQARWARHGCHCTRLIPSNKKNAKEAGGVGARTVEHTVRAPLSPLPCDCSFPHRQIPSFDQPARVLTVAGGAGRKGRRGRARPAGRLDRVGVCALGVPERNEVHDTPPQRFRHGRCLRTALGSGEREKTSRSYPVPMLTLCQYALRISGVIRGTPGPAQLGGRCDSIVPGTRLNFNQPTSTLGLEPSCMALHRRSPLGFFGRNRCFSGISCLLVA